jgi:hypothetical protein
MKAHYSKSTPPSLLSTPTVEGTTEPSHPPEKPKNPKQKAA